VRDSKVDFDTVLELGASLPGVKAGSSARGIALRLKGQLIACTAIHPSAEPNSLMVRIEIPARDALLETQAETYYITGHYRSSAAVLVRLAKIGRGELRDLLKEAVRFVGTQKAKTTSKRAAASKSRRS
jgi:hypothetical protein